MFLNTLPVTKTISFYVTICIGMNILIISENLLLVCPQIHNSEDSLSNDLDIEKINSTCVKLTRADVKITKEDVHFYQILRYRLNLAEVIHLEHLKSCNNPRKELYESGDLDRDIAHCKKILGRFDSARADILNPYCDWKEVSMNLSDPLVNNTILINDLLPSQPYYFYSSINYTRKGIPSVLEEERFVGSICMDEGEPFYPPQTDLGSFKFSNALQTTRTRKNRNHDNSRKVDLYWMPVPRFLAGSLSLSYQISCSNLEEKSLAVNETVDEIQIGILSIPLGLTENSSYLCVLKSKNGIGDSRDQSEIIIPKNRNIIDTKGKFQFYVAEVLTGEYLLRWTKIDSLLLAGESLDSSMKGNYTVYWCRINSPAQGCMAIEGLERTHENFLTLSLDVIQQNRIFGISYKSHDDKYFTGIMWAECIATIRTQAQSAHDPIEIYKAIGSPNNHTTINISWSYRGCRSIITLVQDYEINYCIIRQVDPCLPLTGNVGYDSELLNYGFNDTDVCKNYTVHYELTTEVTLRGLASSTLYFIRIRHKLVNGTINQWSNPVYAITLAEPMEAGECSDRFRNITESLVIIFLALITTGVIYIYIKRKLFHYWSLASQIRKVETQLPQRIDEKLNKKNNEVAHDSNDIGLKFWSNRFSDSRSMGGSSITNSESSLADDKDNCEDRNLRTNNGPSSFVTDYIPNRLMTGYVEQSPMTQLTDVIDDNQKDIISVGDNSVGSQESFLRTIAEEQAKNIDRGTHNSIL